MAVTRIVSLLPAATEMVCALGLTDRLVGISHECHYPAEIANRPRLTRSTLPHGLSQAAIDTFVGELQQRGESLYDIDVDLLQRLEPDLILTQDLCGVCGVSSREVDLACAALVGNPHILRFSPTSIAGIHDNITALGAVADRQEAAARLIAATTRRLARIKTQLGLSPRPRVLCMEWLDPPYASGHWVPEMVELAGGIDNLGNKGGDSLRIAWDEVLAWSPEVVILNPCGFGVDEIAAQASQLLRLPGWVTLPAVRHERVFAVDANAYFACPGPRVIEGIELLARLIHPDIPWPAAEPSAPARSLHISLMSMRLSSEIRSISLL